MYGPHWRFFGMAYSCNKDSVGYDWNQSVLDDETSELPFFHSGEDTGTKIIISC